MKTTFHKSLFLPLVFLSFIGFVSCSKNTTRVADRSADGAAIQAVLDEQLEAWNSGSIDSFMLGYEQSDSMLFMTRRGPQFGWETLRQSYHKSFPNREKMGHLSFKPEEFLLIDPDSYLVIGRWLVAQSEGELSGYFTLLFRLENDEWKIIADHTFSEVKPAQETPEQKDSTATDTDSTTN